MSQFIPVRYNETTCSGDVKVKVQHVNFSLVTKFQWFDYPESSQTITFWWGDYSMTINRVINKNQIEKLLGVGE